MKDNQNKVLSLIGMAKKAGKLITGTDMAVDAIRNKRDKVKLLFCSADASQTTVKRIRNTSEYYKIPLCTLDFDKTELARIVGNRYGQTSVIAVTDEGFAKAMIEKLCVGQK